MAHITFITGGQRSGKSSYAQQLAESKTKNPIYLATARIWDNDFQQRINRHKHDRGNHWQTIEIDKNIHEFDFRKKIVVLDCITLWLTNIYHDSKYNSEQSFSEAMQIWNSFISQDSEIIVISNEIGMGLHAETESGRKFTDMQGFMNQHIAKHANTVFFMVSGIPLQIK